MNAAGELVLRQFAPASSGIDRAAELRDDDRWLAAAWADPGSRVMVVERGRALVAFDADVARLEFVPPTRAPDGVRMLLGVGSDGTAYLAVAGPLPRSFLPSADGAAGVRPASLRETGALLSAREVGLLTHAVALANWHETHVRCPRCGEPTEPVRAGHARRCTADGSEHFPRVDPAIIVLVTDPDDRCLLAHNAAWPEHRVSILAGFVEPGESAEQAVVREVREETGITVAETAYLASQPWPMPQSLMLGFHARAVGGFDIRVDGEEIAQARWFSRDELTTAIEAGELLLPPPVSIAHRIIEAWYGSDLPGAW